MAEEKVTPKIACTPTAFQYGTRLSEEHLNAKATGADKKAVPGSFTYHPALGTVLPVGKSSVTVSFQPEDAAKYSNAETTETVECSKAHATFEVASLEIPYGLKNAVVRGAITTSTKVCVQGQVSIALAGMVANADIQDDGSFEKSFAADKLSIKDSPYCIKCSYSGDCNVDPVCEDAAKVKVHRNSIAILPVLESDPNDKSLDPLRKAFQAQTFHWKVSTIQEGQRIPAKTLTHSRAVERQFQLDHEVLATSMVSVEPAEDSFRYQLAEGAAQYALESALYSNVYPSGTIIMPYVPPQGEIQVMTNLCLGNGQTIPMRDVEVSLTMSYPEKTFIGHLTTNAPNIAEFKNLKPGTYTVKVVGYPRYFSTGEPVEGVQTEARKPITCPPPKIFNVSTGQKIEVCLCLETCKETEKQVDVKGAIVQGVCNEPLPAGSKVELFSLDAPGKPLPLPIGSGGTFTASLAEGRYAMVALAKFAGSAEFQRIEQIIEVNSHTKDLALKLWGPQEGPYELVGVIRNPGGVGIPDLPVALLKPGTNHVVMQTKTNRRGEYSLPCQEGIYHIAAGQRRIPVSVPGTPAGERDDECAQSDD